MSRIGKQPIEIPSGVTVSIDDGQITVESKDARLTQALRPEVNVTWEESERRVVVSIDEKDAKNRQIRAYWGLTRALIRNMVEGVTKGYEKRLEIVGVGWSAELRNQGLELKVGFANTVRVPIPQGVDVNVEKALITVKSADKQAVGQFAADVRSRKPPEPYNGKGIKYSDEVIRRKQGKVFGS